MRRRRAKPKRKRGPWARRAALVLAALALAVLAWFLWPFWRVSAQFGARSERVPSRLYGSAIRLEAGKAVDRMGLVAELELSGYRPTRARSPAPGTYLLAEDGLLVHLRPHPTPRGLSPGGLLRVELSGRWIEAMSWRGGPVDSAELEPPLLAAYYGPQREERWPVRLDELPEHLIQAVLAAEDDSFFRHPGLSVSGIARAAWVNLRGGEVAQGGSTVTQQLVKNLYLTHERSLPRKIREAALAVLLEMRYDKRQILEAYLNEIYWGKSGASLIGVGAAARAYCGKPPAELTVTESALLAGLIRSPGHYAPTADLERARSRRDWVLGRMAELGWLTAAEATAAQGAAVAAPPRSPFTRRAPYFADYAAAEAAARFDAGGLEDGGYILLTTLRRDDQAAAEEALGWGLDALEQGWEKGRDRAGPLQGALVSLDPGSGAVFAYVGGRDYAASQFDRASQAHRQAGSAFKPVVYAAALEDGVAAASSLIEDEPLTVTVASRTWTPANDDDAFRGLVTVRAALEQSLNVPTARLALAVGLPRVVELARAMGVAGELEPYPALALGAFEVTPVELATVYATLAGGGVRPGIHALRAVLAPDGRAVEGAPPPQPERALSPEAAYLVTSLLQGVLDRGTGASARTQGLTDPLAGKTGTTNDRRDSWFAGYSPDRVTLVWVGYDDNATTRLSGSRGALPIWSRFSWEVRPAGGYPTFRQPPGVVTAVIDPASGELATDDCPQVITEAFLDGRVPDRVCRLHGGWFSRPLTAAEELRQPVDRRRSGFWRRLFGKRDQPPDDEEGEGGGGG